MVPATQGNLRVASSYDHCLLNQALDRDWPPLRAPSEAKDDTYSRIPILLTGFSSGAKDRTFIWTPRRRPACFYITTFPLTGYVFGGPFLAALDTRSRILPSAWSTLEQDFARHPPTYIVDVQPEPEKCALAPVKDFPILAKLLTERYQPVAHTAEGVIYHRNDSPVVARHSPKGNR